jgi:hypothetical protein
MTQKCNSYIPKTYGIMCSPRAFAIMIKAALFIIIKNEKPLKDPLKELIDYELFIH